MDIEINEVQEIIKNLESSNELSIKEEKYLNVAKLCVQMAAENVALKAGASYFSYGSEHNFEWHKTAKEAVEAAEAAIDDYRGEACDGWSEEVDSICWGIIMQSSTKVGERPRNEDDCCDPAIDTVCDYALLPNIETPATDRIVAGIKADGVDEFAESQKEYVRQHRNEMDQVLRAAYTGSAVDAERFAKQLREVAEK